MVTDLGKLFNLIIVLIPTSSAVCCWI